MFWLFAPVALVGAFSLGWILAGEPNPLDQKRLLIRKALNWVLLVLTVGAALSIPPRGQQRRKARERRHRIKAWE
jgi:hypothetical protein